MRRNERCIQRYADAWRTKTSHLQLCDVPKPDQVYPNKEYCYSIPSSAVASSDAGTLRPSALAVLRLMASSNLVGCSTGRSLGLAPFRILSTVLAPRRN